MTQRTTLICRIWWLHLLFGLTYSHIWDLCGIGRVGSLSNDRVLTGIFTYVGYDTSNYGKAVWHSVCKDYSIEYGAKYGQGSYYYFKDKTSNAFYARCTLYDTDPNECDGNWAVYSGDGYYYDSNVIVEFMYSFY